MRDLLIELTKSVRWVEERHLLEFCLLVDDDKPVVRVPTCSGEELALLSSVARAMNATLVTSRHKTVVEFKNSLGEEFVRWVDSDSPEPGDVVAYLSLGDGGVARAAEAAEAAGDNEVLAKWLGYPACCAQAYQAVSADGRWAEFLLASSRASLFPWENNKFAYAIYGASLFPDYFPCSLECRGTTELARAGFGTLVRHGFRDLAEQHRELMLRPVVLDQSTLFGLRLKEFGDPVVVREDGVESCIRLELPEHSALRRVIRFA
jgi:hypothetical protein